MITIRENDRAKVIGLVAGIVAVFGFVVMRAQSMSPQPAEQSLVVAPNSTRPQVFTEETAGQAVVLHPEEIVTRSPFRKVLPDPNGTYVAANHPPQPAREVIREPLPSKEIAGRFPTMPGVGVGQSTDLAGASGVHPASFDLSSALQLTGVLTGSHPVAVIQSGQTTQVVGIGENVAGYTVARIAETSVKLRRGSEVVTLGLDK